MNKGYFVTFEGIDGCGKTTQLKLAGEYLKSAGQMPVITREPGGTVISEKIRELLLSTEFSEMVDSTELLLYLASRAQHVEEKIKPSINDGKIVLCDRFQEATLAYQGFGRGIPLKTLEYLNNFAVGGLVPDRTYIFDLSVDDAYERQRLMNKVPDRLESESKNFYNKIRNGYLELASNYPDRIIVLDATKTIDELGKFVRDDLCGLFLD